MDPTGITRDDVTNAVARLTAAYRQYHVDNGVEINIEKSLNNLTYDLMGDEPKSRKDVYETDFLKELNARADYELWEKIAFGEVAPPPKPEPEPELDLEVEAAEVVDDSKIVDEVVQEEAVDPEEMDPEEVDPELELASDQELSGSDAEATGSDPEEIIEETEEEPISEERKAMLEK